MKVNVKGIRLTESQQLIYDAANDKEHKIVVCNLSRQQGKSTVVLLLCIKWLTEQNQEIIYFTPTKELGRRFFDKLIKLLPQELIKKANSTDHFIETITNSSIKFHSGEAAQAARGSNCTKLVIDEAAYIKNEIDGQDFYFNIVMPLTKVHCNKVVMISTPRSTFGFFYDFCMKGMSGERSDVKYIERTIYQDGLIDAEEIERMKKDYPPMAWACEYECKFIANALSVFPNYDNAFDGKYSGGKCWCGIDPSVAGEDNTILTVVNEKNEVRQHKIDGNLDEKYAHLARLINEYNPVATYIENNSIGSVMANEIKKQLTRKSNFYEFTTTNESKKQYISLISVNIANNTIHFEENNKLLYSELGTYTFKLTKTGNITYAAHDGFHDDTISSLGICLQCRENFKFSGQPKMNFVLTKQKLLY